MNLNELPEVVIHPRSNYKFIIAEVCDGNDNKKLVLRADWRGNCESHQEVLNKLGTEAGDLRVRCIGGGRLYGKPKDALELFGSSEDFGKEPDRELTAEMLRKAFPTTPLTVLNI